MHFITLKSATGIRVDLLNWFASAHWARDLAGLVTFGLAGDGLKDFDVDEEEGNVAGKNMTENH